MNRVRVFDDGSVYIKRPGTFGRVNVDTNFLGQLDTEVSYVPVADYAMNTDNKGDNIPINIGVLDWLGNFHTQQAQNWLLTPYMLWINRPFAGDKIGSVSPPADPDPRIECITGGGNVLRVIGETATHYEIYAIAYTKDIAKFDPQVFNFTNYPWIFWKAQNRTQEGKLQKVGAGLDVYHLNLRKPMNRHYIHKSRLTLFRPTPFMLGDEVILDYQCLGKNVYGITDTGRIPLLVDGVYLTEWDSGQPVV